MDCSQVLPCQPGQEAQTFVAIWLYEDGGYPAIGVAGPVSRQDGMVIGPDGKPLAEQEVAIVSVTQLVAHGLLEPAPAGGYVLSGS